VEEMRNFAFIYVKKYAPSKQQLKTYLLKKYMKVSASNVKKKDVNKLIDIVLSDLEKNRFINDQFYSESKAKNMIQRGSSINKIRNYLIGKGIDNEFVKDTIDKIKEDNSDQDFFSAIKICKKKRIGPARTEENRVLFYKKDISLLARNGFDFETSKKIMDMEKEEYIKIINLL
jgi:regulatory protein